jgi:iron complex transport system substrate-binding protein
MLLLDQVEKIAMSMRVTSRWARTIFPEFSTAGDIEVKSAVNPNVEELVAKKIDVVFFWERPEIIQKLAAAGTPVVVTQVPDQNRMESFEAYKINRKKDVQMHGQIFGPEAEKKAEAWSRYFDDKVDYVYSKTKDLPESERPGVYYVRGPDVLTTHSKNSPTWWAMKIAGGRPHASGQTKDVIDRVPAEQFISWNLDVIFMGWIGNTDLVLNDKKWSKVPAVVNKEVFISPDGVFRWDHSSEVPLLIMFFAKKLHPNLFPDLDLVTETKYFYKTFYRYELTDDEANRILTHRPPITTGN